MADYTDLGSYGFGSSKYSTPADKPTKAWAPGTGFANIAGGLASILGSGGIVGLIDELGDWKSISKGGKADEDDYKPGTDNYDYKERSDKKDDKNNSTTYLIVGAIVVIGILYFMNKK